MTTFGLALPHYDALFPQHAVTGAHRTQAALDYAHHAEENGFTEVWVSDHLWLDLDAGPRRRSPDCWTLLAALAAATRRIRLGSLVTNASLRHSALFTHQVATVCDIAGDRVDVGLGAGWSAPEFTELTGTVPPVQERLQAVEHSADSVRHHLGADAPPIWVGGKRRGILTTAARIADGWNLAWDPTPQTYRHRSRMFANAAKEAGRDASGISHSVGLTTFLGSDEDDLHRRWRHLQRWVPGGYLDNANFDAWRKRGLIGTPEEVRHRITQWKELGVSHIVCAFGIPYGICDDEQLNLFTKTILK
ncbi:LLM class flavin-dependent oxidoreductase [Allosalinactinospora lopnorensis]|uniref:LLM class flavin-dependent oxidoreductase n=1 Tax=Allosalinactinospora lopnorensis TaxID=1352348 RepID=UPI000623CA92|nr:LLM class flavin-dependent oxidoreductase [Allosalinactinospora lopnorensis]